ncbi:DUF4433 domain-containing protein [Pseudactinotalea sp. HY160]|uniref:type II toxin-antitoxin system toxin DNA ADP-ribosyl transferase DarT n=1 Tax=Pseudactinotalea sp. HY160 TaxID=2654490 RepID=UPI00128B3232|nr:DUF4433 domain-containing protein [Pseudactinotalea sp. HY160]MPV50871.1 DUF4433 domain-containing protein [Pseudactinotalea sp. HY160]
MAARKHPTWVLHFTPVEHLTTMMKHGLLSDTAAHESGLLTAEVGNLQIKDRRRQQAVRLPPGGAVADYVPFYFAPRSPMMYAISCGNVPTYTSGTEGLVYLVSTLERLHELDCRPMLTDRNAALSYTDYRAFDPADPVDDGFIDWPLMSERYWRNTPEDPQRVERRMAEALVHKRVPWDAIMQIGTQNESVATEVRADLVAAGLRVPVNVRPTWYF